MVWKAARTFGLSFFTRWLIVSTDCIRCFSVDANLSCWAATSSSSMSDLVDTVSLLIFALFITDAICSSVISSSLKSSSTSSYSSLVSRHFFACSKQCTFYNKWMKQAINKLINQSIKITPLQQGFQRNAQPQYKCSYNHVSRPNIWTFLF